MEILVSSFTVVFKSEIVSCFFSVFFARFHVEPSFLPEEWVRVRRDGRICARSFESTTFGRNLISWERARRGTVSLSLQRRALSSLALGDSLPFTFVGDGQASCSWVDSQDKARDAWSWKLGIIWNGNKIRKPQSDPSLWIADLAIF